MYEIQNRWNIFDKILFLRMSDTLSSSVNTTQEDISTTIRTNKNGRAQTISTMEAKAPPPPKPLTTRKLRGKSSEMEVYRPV